MAERIHDIYFDSDLNGWLDMICGPALEAWIEKTVKYLTTNKRVATEEAFRSGKLDNSNWSGGGMNITDLKRLSDQQPHWCSQSYKSRTTLAWLLIGWGFGRDGTNTGYSKQPKEVYLSYCRLKVWYIKPSTSALLLGEASFSFANSFCNLYAQELPNYKSVFATEFCNVQTVLSNYDDAAGNISDLPQNVNVQFGVDACDLSRYKGLEFSHIIWNGPWVCERTKLETTLVNFFKQAEKLQKNGGQIFLRLATRCPSYESYYGVSKLSATFEADYDHKVAEKNSLAPYSHCYTGQNRGLDNNSFQLHIFTRK